MTQPTTSAQIPNSAPVVGGNLPMALGMLIFVIKDIIQIALNILYYITKTIKTMGRIITRDWYFLPIDAIIVSVCIPAVGVGWYLLALYFVHTGRDTVKEYYIEFGRWIKASIFGYISGLRNRAIQL